MYNKLRIKNYVIDYNQNRKLYLALSTILNSENRSNQQTISINICYKEKSQSNEMHFFNETTLSIKNIVMSNYSHFNKH